jgi:hypothetical protein
MASSGAWGLNGLILQRTITLTPAQLLHLVESPVALVSPPGAGKAVVVLCAIASLEFNSAMYEPSADGAAASTSCSLCYAGPSRLPALSLPDFAEVLMSPGSGVQILSGIIALAPREEVEGLEIFLCNPQAIAVDFTSGNSPLTVTVFYLVVDI